MFLPRPFIDALVSGPPTIVQKPNVSPTAIPAKPVFPKAEIEGLADTILGAPRSSV